MPANLVGRLSLAALAFAFVPAAAPAADAQAQPRWQVEASLDATGPNSYSGLVADGERPFTIKQREAVRYSVGASRLARLGPRASLRLGLSLSNKGFTERTEAVDGTTDVHVDLLYLGAPIALGYNQVNPRKGLLPFAEAGLVPELLVRDDESAHFDPKLTDVGISWLLGFGAKYNLGDGRAVTLGPEIRFAARGYSRTGPGEFRPQTVGLKLGIQF
ncbi:MAG TPA: outer membrane beta-barrel protein [Longimicrobium sp.]|nr:outer membrane beta-barrel protein [Longimicrobium sp.]